MILDVVCCYLLFFLLYIYILIVRPPMWKIAAHLAVAGDVFDGVFMCCSFSHEISWMRSGT